MESNRVIPLQLSTRLSREKPPEPKPCKRFNVQLPEAIDGVYPEISYEDLMEVANDEKAKVCTTNCKNKLYLYYTLIVILYL